MNVNFKIVVYQNKQRKDRTFPVNIRIGYKSKYALIETGLSAGETELKPLVKSKKNITSNSKIIREVRNSHLLDICNKKISKYNELIRQLELPENSAILPYNFNVQDIKEVLLRGTIAGQRLDFIQQFEKYLKVNSESASIGAYKATYNHLRAFAGISLLVDDITPNKLKEFETHLKSTVNRWGKNMGSRGINLYMNAVRTVYNWIMDEYVYKGYTFLYPFRKYKVPVAKYDDTVALSKQQLRAIIETPLTGLRVNRVKDWFVISLLSLGTNAKDLYELETVGKRIEYKRSKTKDKRKDEAFISIKVEPELKPYLKKYWYKIGTSPLAQLYSSPSTLNTTIREGMKQIVKQVNAVHGEGFLGQIGFYDARRTMASVMRNKLEISKDDVSKCLNHVDGNRTTDIYIEQDFTIIDKCNRKFIDWLYKD